MAQSPHIIPDLGITARATWGTAVAGFVAGMLLVTFNDRIWEVCGELTPLLPVATAWAFPAIRTGKPNWFKSV